MTKHRSHSAAFKRHVAQEFIAGETLHGLSKRHDLSRQLIRIWVGKYEAGALDDDVQVLADGVRSSLTSPSSLPTRDDAGGGTATGRRGACVPGRRWSSCASARQGTGPARGTTG
jgi:hypothetical protein